MTQTAPGLDLESVQRGRLDVTEGIAGGSARSLLLTTLGELVWRSGEPAWTSALLYVLSGLGVEERAARQAIARVSNAGWISPQRHGRETRWELTPELERVFESGEPRVLSLSDPFADWDGRWLVLFVTVPHELRAVRKRLYSAFEWAGLGNPIAGVWLSPHSERREPIASTIAELGLRDSSLSFLGQVDSLGMTEAEIVRAGWDLDRLESGYRAVTADIEELDPAPGDETLFAQLRLVATLRRFPFADPQLPEALLPDWIGRRVVAQILERRDAWTAGVRARWLEINVPS